MLELYSYCGAGPGGLFLFFISKNADNLASTISTIFHKLVRVGFSICWSIGSITPVSKSGSTSSYLSDYCLITITISNNLFYILS